MSSGNIFLMPRSAATARAVSSPAEVQNDPVIVSVPRRNASTIEEKVTALASVGTIRCTDALALCMLDSAIGG